MGETRSTPRNTHAGDAFPDVPKNSSIAAQSDALSVIGWVDYDRGLVTDGTIRYAWGEVTAVQEYGLVGGAWVLAHQQLRVPGFGATLEISYSGYRFLSRP